MGKPSEYVRSQLETAIPGAAGQVAMRLLEETKFPMTEEGSVLEERIHLAIVKMVREPWPREVQPTPQDKFTESLELGKTDWRDLLVSAGLANDDWPSILRSSGLRPPRTKSWWKFWKS
jgi:hypothetical protein